MLERVRLLPKQYKFIRDIRTRYFLNSGCYRGGKTRSLCYKVVFRASFPGAVEVISRKWYTALMNSTMKTLLEPDGSLPPVLPEELIEHHDKDRHVIQIRGGGQIMYTGMDDPNKVKSVNATGWSMDEATDFTVADFQMADSRISVPIPDLPNQMNFVTNPGAPTHWLCELFGIGAFTDPSRPGETRVMTNSVFENAFLPADYVRSMLHRTGADYSRNVLGQWVGSDALVYASFDRGRHVVDRRIGFGNDRSTRYFLAYDDGFTDPSVFLVFQVCGERTLHIVEEWYKTDTLMSDRVDVARSLCERYGTNTIVADSAAATAIAEFRNAGMDVHGADKNILEGVKLVNQVIADGRLLFDPNATATIGEIESYERKMNRVTGEYDEKPSPYCADHAMDAMRYGVVFRFSKEKVLTPSISRRTMVPPFEFDPATTLTLCSVYYDGGTFSCVWIAYFGEMIYVVKDYEHRYKSLQSNVDSAKEISDSLPIPPYVYLMNADAFDTEKFGALPAGFVVRRAGLNVLPALEGGNVWNLVEDARHKLETGKLKLWTGCTSAYDALTSCRFKPGTTVIEETKDTGMLHAILNAIAFPKRSKPK